MSPQPILSLVYLEISQSSTTLHETICSEIETEVVQSKASNRASNDTDLLVFRCLENVWGIHCEDRPNRHFLQPMISKRPQEEYYPRRYLSH